MPEYRKKPQPSETISAFRLGRDEPDPWFTQALARGDIDLHPDGAVTLYPNDKLFLSVAPNQWIMRHANGRLNACSDGIFEATYDRVSQE